MATRRAHLTRLLHIKTPSESEKITNSGGIISRRRRGVRERERETERGGELWGGGGGMAVEYRCCGAGFFEHIAIIVVLVVFAGLMSGLTLGLMSLSLVDLEVLSKSGTDRDRKYAGVYCMCAPHSPYALPPLPAPAAPAAWGFAWRRLVYCALPFASRRRGCPWPVGSGRV
jgi:metal transporter CNNM